MEEKSRQRDSINRLSTSNTVDPTRSGPSRLSDAGLHVADGFRPASPLDSPSISNPEPSRPPPHRSFSDSLHAGSSASSSGNRRSIRKSPFEEEVDAAGLAASLGLSPEAHPSPSGTHESGSSASSSSTRLDRTQSTYLSRVASFSFSYPRRPPSAAGSSIRPAHPYALYQQTTTFEEPEEETNPEPGAQTITVGFPGNGANYRRRTGPDGEELDVVGPDGHAEALPPYTRYPIQGPYGEKSSPQVSVNPENPFSPVSPTSSVNPFSPVSSVGTPVIPGTPSSFTPSTPTSRPTIVHSHSVSSHATDNVMGLGQPAPQSRSPTIHEISPIEIHDPRDSSVSSIIHEKPRRKKTWRDRRNKKVLCGLIPLWALLMFAILFVFMAIVAGGVIGGLLSSRENKGDK
jgi:hypothetical protein